MRIKLVKSLKGGEVLAQPVLTEEKEILIKKGTVLKVEYLDLISFLGIDTVCIEDPYLPYEQPHPMLSKEKLGTYIERIKKILERHIYSEKRGLKDIEQVAKDLIIELENADEKIVVDMKERGGNLYEHTIMVALLSLMVAKRLKLSDEEIYDLAVACLLHDLGLRYITVPYSNYDVENSSVSESNEFKKHPVLAFSALESEDWMSYKSKKMILSHHERRDGSGFPLKQKIKDIEYNILQACDAFDSMISGTECKRNNVQMAMEYLVEASDERFDKKVVKVIEKMVARYPIGTRLRLNTGENAVVIMQTEDSTHPVVTVLDQEENITDLQYDLNKSRKVTILQVID